MQIGYYILTFDSVGTSKTKHKAQKAKQKAKICARLKLKNCKTLTPELNTISEKGAMRRAVRFDTSQVVSDNLASLVAP